jgi:hypothetical protein
MFHYMWVSTGLYNWTLSHLMARLSTLSKDGFCVIVALHMRRTKISSCFVRYLRNVGGSRQANSWVASE